MHEENYKNFVEFFKKILYKIKPKFSFHYVAYTTLFVLVIFSAVQLVQATTPNPGHPWSELGDGVFVFTNSQTTTPRTYTFPDANATVLTTNSAVTVAQGGTGITSVSDGDLLVTTGANTFGTLAVGAGQSIRRNSGGTAFEVFTPSTGTVTGLSVVSANGFAGSVTSGATPAITLSTSISGMLKGNGTAISAGTDGTDYLSSSTGWKLGGQTLGVKKTLGSTDAYDIGFVTNNSERMTILSGGNVGIGTTTPYKKLTINADSDGEGIVIKRNSASADTYADIGFTLTTTDISPTTYLRAFRRTAFGDNDLLFHVGQSDAMMIKDSGSVGIGTTTPLGTTPSGATSIKGLEINNGSNDPILTLGTSTAGTATNLWQDSSSGDTYLDNRYDSDSGNIYFRTKTAGTSVGAMTILGSGNVGIGTTSPLDKLDVAGTIRAGNASSVQGSLILAGQYSGTQYINTIGGHYSTSGTVIGYAVKPKNGAAGYVSSADNVAWSRGAINLDSAGLHVLTGESQTVTIGNDVTMTEKLSVTNAGNVGIGITNPVAKLDISSGNGNGLILGGDNSLSTRTDATTKYGRMAIPHYTNTEEPATVFVGYSSATENGLQFGGGTSVGNSATLLQFFTAANNTTTLGTERMRITSAGNVGIGTTSPSYKLDVSGDIKSGTTGTAGRFLLGRSADGAVHATISSTGSGAIEIAQNGGTVSKQIMDATGIRFQTYDGAALADRMTILQTSGNVGIGTTTPTAVLHLKAGTATASTAPLKFTSGTNLTTAEAGAMEYDGTELYFTPSTTRETVAFINDFPITIVNSSNLFSTKLSGTGSGVTTTTDSIFLGVNAGNGATGASYSNFFGQMAGYSATNAPYSNFFGYSAGGGATDASDSNFFGPGAGFFATNASDSNFFGQNAGNYATTASNSNFFGSSAGAEATDASYSNLFGYKTGMTFAGNNIGSNNIIIGTNISLPNATANSINLGGVLFATGAYATTTGDPSITAVSGGKVGIGVVSPTAYLNIKAGTATAGTAPLKFTSGTNLTTAEAGAMEYDGTNLYFTPSGTTRKTIAYTSDLTGGYIPYTGGTSNVDLGVHNLTVDTDTLFVDATNHRVGVGTTTPGHKIDVSGVTDVGISVSSSSNTDNPYIQLAGDGGNIATEGMKIYYDDDQPNTYFDSMFNNDSYGFRFRTKVSGTPVDALTIKGSGNVGIGTTAPSSLLHLAGIGTANTPLTMFQAFNNIPYSAGNGFGAARIDIGHGLMQGYIEAGADSETNSASGYMAFGNLQSVNTRTEVMRIASNGKVGIGTTAPGSKLHLKLASSGDGLRIEDSATSNYWDFVVSGTNLYKKLAGSTIHEIRSNGAIAIGSYWGGLNEKIRLDVAGNSFLNGGSVGIGTTSPTHKMTVWSTDSGSDGNAFNVVRAFNTIGWGTGLNISLLNSDSSAVIYGAVGSSITSNTAGSESGFLTLSTRNSGTLSEKLRITNTGNVGIGTTNPSNKLHISGVNAETATLRIQNTNTGGANAFITTTADDWAAGGGLLAFGHGTAGSGAIAMVLKSTGNVGIGTTNPGTKLDVMKSTASPSLSADNGGLTIGDTYVSMQFGSDSNSPYSQWIQGKDRRNNGASYPIALNPLGGNVGIGTTNPRAMFTVSGTGENPKIRIEKTNISSTAITRTYEGLELSSESFGNNYYTPAIKFMSTDPQLTTENPKLLAFIVGRATEPQELDTRGGMALDFATTPNTPGATNIPLTRMTIDQSGYVGIGTTVPGQRLDVNGNINLSNGGDIYFNAGDALIQNITGYHLGFSTYTGVALTEKMRITSTGNVGIGVGAPTATLHLKAGTATASTAPLKFTTGTNLTTTEAGAMEYDGTHLYFTPSTTRETVAFTSDLTTSLASYVPYTGATTNVVLGANTLSTTSGLITPKIYPASDSTTAFQINKADGTTNVLNVDTTNGFVGIGTTTPSALLHVNGTSVFGGTADFRGSVAINTNPDNNSSGFEYGNGFDPSYDSYYYNERFRVNSFLETPHLSLGVGVNYLLQTEAFENSSWVKTGIGAITANLAYAPNGGLLAENIPAGSTSADNISQVITNSSTGNWSAGVWARAQSGTSTISLRIDSSAETGTEKIITLDTKWRFYSISQNFTSANTTKTFRIISGTNAISLWGARLNPGQTVNAYIARTTSASTTATPGAFFNNTTIYGTLSGSASSAGTSTYSNYGVYAGGTLSDVNDKTDKWEYFGSVYLGYNSTYRYGQSWNVEVVLKELSNNNTVVPYNELEKVVIKLKGNMPSVASSTEFSNTVPGFSIEILGDTDLTANDIAAHVASNGTSNKYIYFYVKLKNPNTHYSIEAQDRYGFSYNSAGAPTPSYCYFTAVATAAVLSSLPTPVQGSIVYATKVSGINTWQFNGDNIYNLNSGFVGIGTTTPTSLLALGGTSARTIQMERNTTAATAGQGLTLSSGGAIAGTNNLAGGDLILKSGISTGTGTSDIRFFTATAGTTGSTDNTPTEKMTIFGNGNVGIGTTDSFGKVTIKGTGNYSSSSTSFTGLVIENGGGYGSANTMGSGLEFTSLVLQRKTAAIIPFQGPDVWQTGLSFWVHPSSNPNSSTEEALRIDYNKNIGIGTTTPTSLLALGGTSARTIQMERNTTAATAGQGLTLSSGGAIAGTNNLAGGDLILKSGISTGTGTSDIRFFTATAGTTGSTDNTPTEKMTILGNGNVGIGTTSPTALLDVYGYTHIGKSANTPQKTLSVSGNLNFDTVTNPTTAQEQQMVLTNNGSGNIEAGKYYYGVMFATAEGDTGTVGISYSSLPNITLSSSSQVVISNIPTSSDPRVTSRKIYRSQAGSDGDYYYVYYIGTINDNTTTTYIDNSARNTTSTDWLYNKNNTTSGIVYRNGSVFGRLGDYVTAFGNGALGSLTRGSTTSAFGSSALVNVTSGDSNQAFGHSSLSSITTGSSNVAMGYASGQGNQTGNGNVSIGQDALRNNSSQSYTGNTAVGTQALGILVNSNNYNNALGYGAGYNAQGSYNTYVGYYAGRQGTATTVGTGNLVLGYNAGSSLGSGNYNVLIGYDVELGDPTSSSQLNIGNILYGTGMATGSTPATNGKVGIGTTTPTAVLHLKAGTATASTAPLKFTTGTNLTTTEAGAMEYDGTHLYFTPSTTRETVAFTSDLTTSLASYVPYTGATTNVVLGANTLSTTSGLITPKIYPASDSTTAFQINKADGTTNVLNVDTTNGFVGIGTTGPGSKLDVEGNIRFGDSTNGYAYLNSGSWGTEIGFIDTSDNAIAVKYADTGKYQFGGTLGGTDGIIVDNAGKVGIGTTTPTAVLHLKAGTATASTAPLKFTTGTNLTTPEAGAMEYDGTELYFTPSGTTRETIAYMSDFPITIVNSSNLFSTKLSGTGSGVTTTTDSIFLGVDAGNSATGANNSNFLGLSAGKNASGATYSNFLGSSAGNGATSASYSNFLGQNSGLNATDASYSNFIGPSAGNGATNASNSNFFGYNSGLSASYASSANFFGVDAGSGATYANDSTFIGYQAGMGAIYAANSNFIGGYAGSGATSASYSNFFGTSAGADATDASYSNFLGSNAGNGATNSTNSNFFGDSAGMSATDATNSNFFGQNAGDGATYANDSNFLGKSAGILATDANNSNFIGQYSGYTASSASYSNFIGYYAGSSATTASNSIFIGRKSGFNDTVDNTASANNWSILIGYNTRTGGYGNSILLGGSNSTTAITNTKANQFMLADTITDVRWRGVEYALPSAQGSANSIISNNGSGALSWTDTPTLTSLTTPLIVGGTSTTSSLTLKTTTGVGTTGADMHFLVGDNGATEAMTILNDGSVGIGDTSPDGTLDIDSSIITGVNFGITNTGVYTGTGLLSVVANSATTGTVGIMTANGLSSGSILSLTSDGTAGLTNQKVLNIALSGTNATSAQTTYGAYISNTHAGTTSTNVGLYASATGGTTANYAAQLNGDLSFTNGANRTISVLPGTTQADLNLTVKAGDHSEGDSIAGDLYLKGGMLAGGYSPFSHRGGNVYIEGGYSGGLGSGGSIYIYGGDADGLDGNIILGHTGSFSQGKVSVGSTTTTSLFNVGTSAQFQINTTGAIAAITGYTQGSGTMSLTSANTTQTTTGSAFAGNFNSLTTGTGMYLASSSLTSGTLLDIVSTGTGALTNQKGINVALSGTNATSAQTTYGAYISNTHAGTTSTNVGLYASASGGTTANYAAIFANGNVGIGTTSPDSLLQINVPAGQTTSAFKITQANSTGYALLQLDRNTVYTASASIYSTAGVPDWYTGVLRGGGSSNSKFSIGSSSEVSGSKLVIDTSGNVGIGTNFPTNILSLGNTQAQKFWIENSASGTVGRALTVAAGSTIGGTNITGGNLILQAGLGTGTGASTISFQTGTTLTTGTTLQTMSTKMTILGNGKVGIGTSNPSNILSLDGTSARIIWMERNTTAATAGQGLTLSSGGAIAGTTDLAGGDLILKSGISTGTGTSALRFFTATAGTTGSTDNTPTEKMTILGSGNVGIGTTAPSFLMHLSNGTTPAASMVTGTTGFVYSSASAPILATMSASDTSNNRGIFKAIRARGTLDTPTAVAENDTIMSFLGAAHDGTALQIPATIDMYVDGTVSSGVVPARISFVTGTNSSTRAERLTIKSTGNVGIGTTSPSYSLQVGSSSVSGIVARFQNSSGTCDINPTTSTLSCSSDINLKKNIKTFNDEEFILNQISDSINSMTTLEKINSLTPVTYNWNSENDTDNKHIGFIAQEMEQIFPDLVSTDEETGLKSIGYSNLTPYLVEAIKEMDLKVKNLELNGTNTFGEYANIFFNEVVVGVEGSIAYMKDLVVESIKVGSPEKRTGITLYDEVTGEPYCLSVANGNTKTVAGECGIITPPEPVENPTDDEITEGEVPEDGDVPNDEIPEGEVPEDGDVAEDEITGGEVPAGDEITEGEAQKDSSTSEEKIIKDVQPTQEDTSDSTDLSSSKDSN